MHIAMRRVQAAALGFAYTSLGMVPVAADDTDIFFRGVGTETGSTFVVPGSTISQFNLLTHHEDVYFAVFKPSSLPRWRGNLKKYKIGTGGANINAFVGQNNTLAVDPDTGFFAERVKSFWTHSATADGARVERGGAAMELPQPDNRNVYTYYSGADITIKNNILDKNNADITTAMLGITAKADPDAYRSQLLDWARGMDVLDADGDGNKTEARREMGDPLHSAPVTITYGGTASAPDFTLFITTNEGYLHAFDTDTGAEIFAFMPEKLLPNLAILYDNVKTDAHPYGLDGSITKWVHDANGDGDIEVSDGDYAYLYFGMRRGGDHYYALDVTDRRNPKLMWVLDGGMPPYAEMGQSWADPVKAKVAYTENDSRVTKDVLLVSGGYDADQDNHNVRTADNEGRAVFMIEAGYPASGTTPTLIWSAGNGVGHDLNLSDMHYSIPGAVKAGDTNGDGLVDIMFVADLGGQIWRFDVDNGAAIGNLVSAGIVADISATDDAANTRRFYADVDATTYIQNGRTAIALTLGSGWRANPLSEIVNDRFYMIKQSFPKPASYTTLTESDLYNATANLAGRGDDAVRAQARHDLNAAAGWYITLEGGGEKVLAQSFTLQSQVYFTAYEPKPASFARNASVGASYLYGINLFDATPVFEVGNTPVRRVQLSSGNISPQPKLIITPDGTPKITVAAEAKNPSDVQLVKKTYWFQPTN